MKQQTKIKQRPIKPKKIKPNKINNSDQEKMSDQVSDQEKNKTQRKNLNKKGVIFFKVYAIGNF